MIALYQVNKKNIDEKFLSKILPAVSPEVQQKIHQCKNPKDHWRIICSDLLVKIVLSRELGVSTNRIKIERDAMGKPYLLDGIRHFNLSHADDLIVLVTDKAPVGIDVEYVHSFDEMDDVKNVFSQKERKQFQILSSDNQIDYFYKLWTLKESYIKAIGKGLNIPLDSFDIIFLNNNAILSSAIDGDLNWHFKLYEITSDYKCSVCSRNDNFPSQIKDVSQHDLLNPL